MTYSLLNDLRDPDPLRQEKGLVLARFLLDELHDEVVCQALADHLSSANEQHRAYAARALAERGCCCARLLPVLLRALQNPSPAVRAAILVLFRDFPPGESISALLEPFLDDPAELVRIQAARALWRRSPDAERIRPIIVAALSSDDRDCVIQALHLAYEMHEQRSWLIEPLRACARRPDEALQGSALYLLYQFEDNRSVLLSLCEATANASNPRLLYARSRILRGLPVNPQGYPA